MKKGLVYLVIIILGVASIFTLMSRSNALDNNVSKGNNVIKLFA